MEVVGLKEESTRAKSALKLIDDLRAVVEAPEGLVDSTYIGALLDSIWRLLAAPEPTPTEKIVEVAGRLGPMVSDWISSSRKVTPPMQAGGMNLEELIIALRNLEGSMIESNIELAERLRLIIKAILADREKMLGLTYLGKDPVA